MRMGIRLAANETTDSQELEIIENNGTVIIRSCRLAANGIAFKRESAKGIAVKRKLAIGEWNRP